MVKEVGTHLFLFDYCHVQIQTNRTIRHFYETHVLYLTTAGIKSNLHAFWPTLLGLSGGNEGMQCASMFDIWSYIMGQRNPNFFDTSRCRMAGTEGSDIDTRSQSHLARGGDR